MVTAGPPEPTWPWSDLVSSFSAGERLKSFSMSPLRVWALRSKPALLGRPRSTDP